MKKIIALMVCLVLVLVSITGCTTSNTPNQGENEKGTNSNETITFKLGHATQTTHPYHIAAEKFAELVNDKSDGRLIIEVFPARALGDDRELAEQVMNGTIDMGVIAGSILSSYTPLLDSLQLPFLLNSYDREFKALKSDEMKELLSGLEDFKIKGLGVFEGGMRYVANNVRPISTPDDFAGLKLRVAPSDLLIQNLETLGANPTPMAYGEVYSGLQTNVIDGEEINLTSIYAEKHYEVLKYVSLVPLFPFPGLCAMNLDTYNELSPEDQVLLEEASMETIDYLLTQLEEMDATALETIKEKNVEVNKVDNFAPFLNKTQSVYDSFLNKDNRIKEFVDMVNNMK